MDISSIVVLAIVILIILSLLMMSIEMFLPIQVKLRMIGILRPYLLLIESEGSLNEKGADLISELEAIHLEDIDLTISDQNKFGDLLEFKVSGNYYWEPIISIGKRKSKSILMTYERKIFIRKITN